MVIAGTRPADRRYTTKNEETKECTMTAFSIAHPEADLPGDYRKLCRGISLPARGSAFASPGWHFAAGRAILPYILCPGG